MYHQKLETELMSHLKSEAKKEQWLFPALVRTTSYPVVFCDNILVLPSGACIYTDHKPSFMLPWMKFSLEEPTVHI